VSDDEILKRIRAVEWYHSIEVAPGIVTSGRYDPTPVLPQIGFPEDLTGKTVLDIGTYDGFFAFEAEKRGAQRVLAMDRHPATQFGFSTAHELLRSRVEYTVGSVYDLSPETHGTFDVVIFVGVLYHLRHPLLALDRIHSVCREYAVVESHVLDRAFVHEGRHLALDQVDSRLGESCLAQYYPGNELSCDWSNWWSPTVECLRAMLATSGFTPTLSGRWGQRAAFRAVRNEFTPPHWY
jgi:tRNA (mo5U34)-methyltransferase